MISDCAAEDAPNPCNGRRRLVLKYDTITGIGVQSVERRGLIDSYQIANDVYMIHFVERSVTLLRYIQHIYHTS